MKANNFYFSNKDQEHLSVALTKSPELLAQRIQQLNLDAEKKIKNKEFTSALASLKAGQKILEYVAESCKDVKKELIIIILHNIVCVNQMVWNLENASDYLEGIIYNMEITSNLNQSRSLSKLSFLISQISQTVDLQDDLVSLRYYLQYCAINSSLERHQNAEIAAKKAFKLSLAHLKAQQKEAKKYIVKSSALKQAQSKWLVILALIEFKVSIDSDQRKQELFSLIWTIHQSDCQTFRKKEEQSLFKEISIGNIMTLHFKHFREKSGQKKAIEDSEFYIFLLASISFFSLSTEINFNSRGELNQAKNYHFLSLLLYLLFIPFESPYIFYLLETYNTKYTKMMPKVYQKKKYLKDITDLLKTYEQNYDLPQESVATPIIYRRINQRNMQRVKVQSKRLKQILQFDVKTQKTYNKSQSLKAHSLSLSKCQLHKLSYDSQVRKKEHNRTDVLTDKKNKNQSKSQRVQKKKLNKISEMNDQMGERYYALAFESGKNPGVVIGRNVDSERSSNDTKDRSSSGIASKISTSKGKRAPLKEIRSKRKLKL